MSFTNLSEPPKSPNLNRRFFSRKAHTRAATLLSAPPCASAAAGCGLGKNGAWSPVRLKISLSYRFASNLCFNLRASPREPLLKRKAGGAAHLSRPIGERILPARARTAEGRIRLRECKALHPASLIPAGEKEAIRRQNPKETPGLGLVVLFRFRTHVARLRCLPKTMCKARDPAACSAPC